MIIYVLSIKPDEYEKIIQELFGLNETNLDRFRDMIMKSVEQQQHFEHHENVLIFKQNVGYDYVIKTTYLSHDDQVISIQKAIQCGPVLKITQDNQQLIVTYASELSAKIAKLYFEQVYTTLAIDVQKSRESQNKPQIKQKEGTVVQPQRQQTSDTAEKFAGDQNNCICAYSLNKTDSAISTLQNIVADLKIKKQSILNVYCLKSQKQNILIEFKSEVYCKQYKQEFSNSFTKDFKYRLAKEVRGQYIVMQNWQEHFDSESSQSYDSQNYEQRSNDSNGSESM